MKAILSLLAGFGMIFGVVSAVAGDQSAIRAGGSTTLLPIMANCSSEFMEKYQTWDKVDASLPIDDDYFCHRRRFGLRREIAHERGRRHRHGIARFEGSGE